MDASPASNTDAAPSAAASRGGFRGRGRGGSRGDSRGRGRGGDRGRGAFRGGRGDSRGRGRGHGHGRGRGGGGGGRGYVPKKAMRHRSLSGKHGANPGEDGAPAAKREKKDQKPNSNFALMHSMLGDVAMIAEYIRDYHSSERFRDLKAVNMFLQAISQRPEELYEDLMANHKDAVFTVLERLFAVYALGKHAMIPPAHEFLLRCEQHGVRKSSWAEGVKTLPEKAPEQPSETAEGSGGNDGAAAAAAAEAMASSPPSAPMAVAPALPAEATSLLSPRELLKKMAALDPVGRLQRLIELSTTVEEVHVCARKVAALLSESHEGEGGAGEKFDFAAQCQLVSKLLSKARRVVEPAFAPASKPKEDAESTEKAEEATEQKGEEKEEEAEEEAEGAADTADAEVDGEKATSVPVRRRGPLSEEEVSTFQSVMAIAFAALEGVLKHRAPNVTQQPLSKFTKVLEWCKGNGLLASEDERFITLLEQQAESDLVEQATQLETVITLKSLTTGDSAALRAVVDQLWEAGGAEALSPCSVDVLSALAVAASAAGIDEEVKRSVADKLVQTQRHLPESVVLPRRALRFVNEERNKVKQAAIAKQLEDEAARYNAEHPDGPVREAEDEEDMALERA